MRYLILILLTSSLAFSNNLFGFYAVGKIAGLIGNALFDPIIRKLGEAGGKLTAHEIDMLKSKGINVWPDGATPKEIEELKKEGYSPSLDAWVGSNPYAADSWIIDWRYKKAHPLVRPKNVEKVDPNIVKDFEKMATATIKNPNPSPFQAAEMLRQQYLPLIIKIAKKMEKDFWRSIWDAQNIPKWRALINQLKPLKDKLLTIVKKDPYIYNVYSKKLISVFDKFLTNPVRSTGNDITVWISHPENKKLIYGPPLVDQKAIDFDRLVSQGKVDIGKAFRF